MEIIALVWLRHPPTCIRVLRGVLFALAILGVADSPPTYAQAKAAPHASPSSAINSRASTPQQRPAVPPSGDHATNSNHPSQTQQQHLSQWMDTHRTLPLAQQQSALEAEPGFHELKPQEQQRMRNQLTRLNSMPPEQRQLAIARTEWMERLAPPQRQQVRAAMAQVGSLPLDRSRAVGRAFRSLRDLPESQRQAYLNSSQARTEFNNQERETLNNLLNVAPLIPPALSSGPR